MGFASKKFKISKTQEGEDEQLEGQIHDPMVEGNMESAQEEGEKLPEERGIEVNIEQHTGEYGHDQILENVIIVYSKLFYKLMPLCHLILGVHGSSDSSR